MNKIGYKGFYSFINWSIDDNVFHGKAEGITDLITFEGKTFEEAKINFKFLIDEYIEMKKGLDNDTRG